MTDGTNSTSDIPIQATTIMPRYRVSASISTKGTITWDCTVEKYGSHPDDILAEHDYLVAQLKLRYPVKES